ncbi:AAA family ATPase [Arthrobacter sp.]|uniref:AAA family ATPase n=1 Tax=Arthrobacter sp. TaxID=1667 RepID=UPI00289C6B6E|nr:AAA family ATPase [Arthrobacter sp.]
MNAVRAASSLVGRESVLESVQTALKSGTGTLIVGPPGIGKSALATAALEAAGGFCIVSLHGSRVSRRTSYGAMAWLLTELPASAELHPLQVLQQLRDLLRHKAKGRPILICVDDAEELDGLSALVISQLVRGGDATVIATVQDILLAAPDLLSLWSDGYLQRTDLEPLAPFQTRHLMERVAGGKVSERAGAAMWAETRGSPHFTILMTREQIESRRLVRSEGVWVMAAPYVHTGEIAEVISAQISGLSPEERRAVEILSFTGSLPLTLMLELSLPEVLDALEESGTVHLSGSPVPMVRIRNATLATVVAENVPLGRSHQLWKEVSAVLNSSSGLDPLAADGYVAWSLSCGAEVGEDLVLRAAKAGNANGDNAAALACIRSVAKDRRSQELVCEEVRALTALGENQKALDVLRYFEPGFDDSRRGSWVELMVRKAILLRSLPKEGNAQSVLDSLLGDGRGNRDSHGTKQHTPAADPAIILAQAEVWLAEGEYTRSVGPLVALAAREDLSPGTRAVATAMAAEALSVTGRAGEGMELLERSWPVILMPRSAADQTAVLSRVFYAFYAAGELKRAQELLGSLGESKGHGHYRGSAGELAAGFIRAAAGEGDAALEFLLPAVGQLRYYDPENLMPLAAALVAYAYRLSGNPAQAAAYTAMAPRFRHRPFWYPRQMTTYFRVLAGQEENPEAASRALSRLADEALGQGNVSFALICLERAASLGDRTAAAALATTAEGVSGRWARVLAGYGYGIASRNPRLLLDAAHGAQELGQHLLAHHAARLITGKFADTSSRSDLREAAGIENTAFRKLRRENGVEQKLGELSEFDAGLVRLAAGKLTRTQIAEELHLSPRTVDWHLGKLFDRLHVSGRDELREILR